MNIIGISGLENAMPFKQARWPGLDEREYRISQGHDAAAALVIDGHPVAAAAEERFNREKHSGKFPAHAIAYCLKEAGLALEDIDEIAHSFDYEPYRLAYSLDPETARFYEKVCSRETLLDLARRYLPVVAADRIHSVKHHLAHAASAYYTSGWDECLVVVADGMGEAHGFSVYHGTDGTLKPLAFISALDSIGILYSLVTLHLGFDFNADEYKIMGLAPYGDPARFRHVFQQMVQLWPDGTIRIPALRANHLKEERENYSATRAYLEQHLVPPRDPAAEITQTHRDIAAALQECLDNVMLHICGHFGA